MNIYTYIYIYIYIYTYIYTHTHTYTHTYIRTIDTYTSNLVLVTARALAAHLARLKRRGCVRKRRRHPVSVSPCPLHDIVITIIVWCMANTRVGAGGGRMLQNGRAIVLQSCGKYSAGGYPWMTDSCTKA